MYKKLDDNAIELILETGIDEFADKGLDGANINNIAKKAGVSVGVLYKYFDDKEGFFLQCVSHSLKQLDRVLAEAVSHETDIEAGVRSIIEALIRHANEHSGHNALYNEISSGSCRRYAPRLAQEIEQRSARAYSKLLSNAQAAGRIDQQADPKIFAFLMDNLLMMMQFSFSCDYYRERMKIFCGEDIIDNKEKLTEQFMRFMLSALKA